MRFADAHVHLAVDGVDFNYPDIENAELLLSCAAHCTEWEIHEKLEGKNIIRFYGVHPWYAEEWNENTKQRLEDVLNKDPDANIGEIGLDNKHDRFDLQLMAFRDQILTAARMGRTVNIHNIGCDGDTIRIIRKYGKGCRSFILHSFKGPDVKPYAGLNCYFSINPRILAKSRDNVSMILNNIPRDRLLVETDSPYTSRYFDSMRNFIVELASIMDMNPEELARTTLENARRAVG